jgi:CRISPR-associated protein (TIGR03984 family)
MSNKLIVHRREKISLTEALSAFATMPIEGAVALLYSPQSCEFALLAGTQLWGKDGLAFDLSQVFEARIFAATAEMRWLNDPGPECRHCAVMISEQDHSANLGSWEKSEKDVIETLPQTYLLWGEGTEQVPSDGWSQLATARIGALAVPVRGVSTKEHRVILHTIEYLVEAEHGNVIVADERLCRLEVTHG